MNTMNRITGILFSGFVVRLAGAGLALYVAFTVGSYVIATMHTVHAAMGSALAG